MNGVRLLDLAVAVAAVVPSATADPHAGLEWRAVRVAWLTALSELGLSEERARDLASRRHWSTTPPGSAIS